MLTDDVYCIGLLNVDKTADDGSFQSRTVSEFQIPRIVEVVTPPSCVHPLSSPTVSYQQNIDTVYHFWKRSLIKAPAITWTSEWKQNIHPPLAPRNSVAACLSRL